MATKIEWCDEVWNPVIGCTKVSEGCQHCYAERMAARLAKIRYTSYYRYAIAGGKWNGEVFPLQSRLEIPLHWRKPRRIFVCSMSDLFHEAVPFEFIDKIWEIMMWSGAIHDYLILTKRPQRLAEYIKQNPYDSENIWLGVTAENQKRADERIPILLQTPAAKRFVSLEPMLGPVDLALDYSKERDCCNEPVGKHLDWVIVGGESGPGARPLHPDWVRSVRDQCKAAGVPFFFKQWGRYYPVLGEGIVASSSKKVRYVKPGPVCIFPVGKKAAGCLLDGREYKEWPE